MKRVLVLLMIVALAAPAFATDSRLGQPDKEVAPYQFLGNGLAIADVLICLDIDANPGFADPTPLYADAFEAAGALLIATCAVEASGGLINFPPDMTATNYPVIVVLTSENWWSSPQNIDPEDEAALAAYLESGGNLLLVGQDYMWGAHPEMNMLDPLDPQPCSGFPRDYLGLDACYQDVLWGPNTANISGSVGWIFEGESAFLDSANVFLSNPFFPDCADPVSGARAGGYAFYYDDYGQDGCVVYHETETFKTVWAGVELSAASTAEFASIIEKIYDWFVGITPVEDTSWAHIKSMYK